MANLGQLRVAEVSACSEVRLYRQNGPERFWRLLLDPAPAPAEWDAAVRAAAPLLPREAQAADIETLLCNTLGEGQFGPNHWRLDPLKRAYYGMKPILPRRLSSSLRRMHRSLAERSFRLGWPIEPRYASFQWEVVDQLLQARSQSAVSHIHFWPQGRPFAFALTHDVETAEGQAFVRTVADLDASYGFRSSFNFVAEDYPLDKDLIDELRERGFEIGLHGLRHNGKTFRSHTDFLRQAKRINHHLRSLKAVGFRTPLTHRHPGWMQALDIEYDLSFFDTDPYEPLPGGTMSLWPFVLGRFVELPYTLVQDHTLAAVLRETTPRLWLEKVDFIRKYSGLALVISHPDYLRDPQTWRIYVDFLRAMRNAGDFWHALPRDVAQWWRQRAAAPSIAALDGAVERTIDISEASAAGSFANAAQMA